MSSLLQAGTARRAWRFAEAASVLADEAALLTLSHLGAGHEADVARRAAAHAREAASELDAMAASEGATLDAVLEAATWAMAAAAVALTQAKLPPGTSRAKVA
jgi:hypothetical protein